MGTYWNGHQPLRTSDHLWGDWLSLAYISSPLAALTCWHCRTRDATFWNYDDELGDVFSCDECINEVYEPVFTLVDEPVFDEVDEEFFEELQGATFAFIQEKGQVTFHELEGFLRLQGVLVEGDWGILHPGNCRLTLWAGISSTVMDLVMSLEDEGKIAYQVTSALTYIDDGGVPDFAEPAETDTSNMACHELWAPTVLVPRHPRVDPGAPQPQQPE